jgi:hypothetical protein
VQRSLSPEVVVLGVLNKSRLAQLAREVGTAFSTRNTQIDMVQALSQNPGLKIQRALPQLSRDELKAACKSAGISTDGRDRTVLVQRLLAHFGIEPQPGDTIAPTFAAPRVAADAPPVPGNIVVVRRRQYLVEAVNEPDLLRSVGNEATLVHLVGLDDDNSGHRIAVLWELELGARVIATDTEGLGEITTLDPPARFAAYLNARRWHNVTATDTKLLQAPFRAGIELMHHQITPLKRALALPRANLFIADDVGLGKTIEAGLVMQELILRQQVEFVCIVAPASVCLQWQDEMQKRFGLAFAVYNRDFVARRQRERGFAINPWTTNQRFIISYQTLRRPEYRDPLLAHLGERARKSMLVLDEAHTAAPATASKYAVDSQLTKVIRDIAPRFDHRLFLSATPHNGHSNSFSALLELLDPQRFTRGVPPSEKALETIMVRRLKSDLRAVGAATQFPTRVVVQHDVGSSSAPEVELSKLLSEYTALCAPKQGRQKLVFINLQKRLLSSVEAFCRTLELHASSIHAPGNQNHTQSSPSLFDDADSEDDDLDDDQRDQDDAAEAVRASAHAPAPPATAAALLSNMQRLASSSRDRIDAKLACLLAWMGEHLCPALARDNATDRISKADGTWTERRVLIFTEYGDTKRYLEHVLRQLASNTNQGDDRIATFHGCMTEDKRAEVATAFNASPTQHPLRILIATDAAREGVNLQGYCADLFHFDIPWNPARMEQRNGRIDRALQPSPEVRCHYFYYPHRLEDVVLQRLVQKVDTITQELGSLGAVVLDHITETLGDGIAVDTSTKLDNLATAPAERIKSAARELEAQRPASEALRKDLAENARLLKSSRELLNFNNELLRPVIDEGLQLAGAAPLTLLEAASASGVEPLQTTVKKTKPVKAAAKLPRGKSKAAEATSEAAPPEADADTLTKYTLPDLGPSWQSTLDLMRPPRGPEQDFYDWRKTPPVPVVFEPPKRVGQAVAYLHLSHPLVTRILDRFRSQGFAAHDLSRVSALVVKNLDVPHVIGFGRLSLFGTGATRLHDEIISSAATFDDGDPTLDILAEAVEQKLLGDIASLLAAPKAPGPTITKRLAARAAADFAALWPTTRAEADDKAALAQRLLRDRATVEAADLVKILTAQREAILARLGDQLDLFGNSAPAPTATLASRADRDQRDQLAADRDHMKRRLESIANELNTEPAAITSLYDVSLTRLEPLGLLYLWPAAR